MRNLISKLLVFSTIIKQMPMNPDWDDDDFNIQPRIKGVGPVNTCSIIRVSDNLHFNELFLFCYEYEIPLDYNFYIHMDEQRTFKFILKAFNVSRIIKRNKSTYPVDKNQFKLQEPGTMKDENLRKCFGKKLDMNEEQFKDKIKECDIEFLNLSNFMEGKETLYLNTEYNSFLNSAKSYILYSLGKDKKLEESLKDLLQLEILITSSFDCDDPIFNSYFNFYFIIKNSRFYIEYDRFDDNILDLKLKEKLLEKSKMQKNEEGKELNFRFPKEEEKKEILEKLAELFDRSILSLSIKTEEITEKENKTEKRQKFLMQKKKMGLMKRKKKVLTKMENLNFCLSSFL